MSNSVNDIMRVVSEELGAFELYANGISKFFMEDHQCIFGRPSVVHSVKYRIKNPDNLRNKINRKITQGRQITTENVFQQITDIAGVRVLHLHLEQLRQIDDAIRNRDWIFIEKPKAYSWDPETIEFMKQLELQTHFKESFYTSVHYVVRPNPTSPLSCEIQVRTLFEEIWGEVDHMLNYPNPTGIFTSSEQLKVLAKIVSAGSRSVDCLFKTHAAALQSTPSVSQE